MKECRLCGVEKPDSEFYASELVNKGKPRCLPCIRTQRQRSVNSDHVAYLRRTHDQLKSQRAKKNPDIPWEIDLEHLIELWDRQDSKCALSGVFMTHHRSGKQRNPYNASIDRINPTEGYVRGNIQLICSQVNTLKHAMDEAELYWWIRTLYHNSFSGARHA